MNTQISLKMNSIVLIKLNGWLILSKHPVGTINKLLHGKYMICKGNYVVSKGPIQRKLMANESGSRIYEDIL